MIFFLDLVDLELVIPIISELSSLSRIYRIFTYRIIDKLIILYNDNESEDNKNLDPRYAYCIIKSK